MRAGLLAAWTFQKFLVALFAVRGHGASEATSPLALGALLTLDARLAEPPQSCPQ